MFYLKLYPPFTNTYSNILKYFLTISNRSFWILLRTAYFIKIICPSFDTNTYSNIKLYWNRHSFWILLLQILLRLCQSFDNNTYSNILKYFLTNSHSLWILLQHILLMYKICVCIPVCHCHMQTFIPTGGATSAYVLWGAGELIITQIGTP